MSRDAALFDAGVKRVEDNLFNGEYFIQQVEWKILRASRDAEKNELLGLKDYSPEAGRCSRRRVPSTSTALAACRWRARILARARERSRAGVAPRKCGVTWRPCIATT